MDSLFDFKDIKKLIRLAESLDEKGLHKEADGIEESISSVIGYGKGGGGLKKFSDEAPATGTPATGTPATGTPATGTPATGPQLGVSDTSGEEITGGYSYFDFDDWSVSAGDLKSKSPNVFNYLKGKGQNYWNYDFYIKQGNLISQGRTSQYGLATVPTAINTVIFGGTPGVLPSGDVAIPEKSPLPSSVTNEVWLKELIIILEAGGGGQAGVSQLIQRYQYFLNQISQAPAAAQKGEAAPTGTGMGTGGRGRGGSRTGTGGRGRPGTAGGETPEQPPTSTGIITKTLSDGSILYYKMGPRRRYIGVIDYDPDGSKGLGPQRSTRYVFYNTETKAIQESTFRFPMTNDEKAQVDQIKKNVVDRKRAERAARRGTARQTNIQQNQTARTQAQTARQTGRTERQEVNQAARTERQEVNQAARTERQDANQAGRAAKKEENQAQRDARQEANQAKRTTRQQENQAQRDARQAANQAKRRRG